MQILVDADAFPGVIVNILFRAVERVRVPLILVSNKHLKTPQSLYISSITVSAGFDVADNRIVAMVQQGGLVITADIPLFGLFYLKGLFIIVSSLRKTYSMLASATLFKTSFTFSGAPSSSNNTMSEITTLFFPDMNSSNNWFEYYNAFSIIFHF